MNKDNPYSDELNDDRLKLTDEKNINGTKYLYYDLMPKPIYLCPNCKSNDTIKHGIKTRSIKANVFAHVDTRVLLTYHVFRCKTCKRYFCDESTIVEKFKSISKSTALQILLDAKEDLTFKYIAEKNKVDVKTVISIFTANVQLNRLFMPNVLCIDEFKNLKNKSGKYAVVLYYPNEHKIVDIIENRQLYYLRRYFLNVPMKERRNVKYFISDMYECYRTVKEDYFPEATHIVDSFHYIRAVTDAFDKVRLKVMKSFKDESPEYKTLKKYAKLFLEDFNHIKNDEVYNYFLKKDSLSEEIVDKMTGIDPSLKTAYSVLQDFYSVWNNIKYENAKEKLMSWINEAALIGLPEFESVSKTFLNWLTEIVNSFIRFGDRRLNNGYIEGINNRIKNIKRISYGYKNFDHFRTRLMYCINDELTFTIKKVKLK